MVTRVDVSGEITQRALSHARDRLNFEYDRFNLKTEQRISMITIGTIGQLIFKQYLEERSIPHEFQLQFGEYDDFDFKIKDRIVEIKSSGFKNDDDWKKLNGIYNASQLEQAISKNFFCSVQIFINGYDKVNKLINISKCNTAIIAGWLEIGHIAKIDPRYLPHGKAHLIPLNKLKSMDELLDL